MPNLVFDVASSSDDPCDESNTRSLAAPPHPDVAVVDDITGKRLVAARDINKGERLVEESGPTTHVPDMHTIQVSRDRHFHPLGAIRFTNHSCSPNCKMDTALLAGDGDQSIGQAALVATEFIPVGTPLLFDYNTTEWDMAEKFECLCKSSSCVGKVGGFKLLPPELQASKSEILSPWMRSLWDASIAERFKGVTVFEDASGKWAAAGRDLKKGELFAMESGIAKSTPDRYTIQISMDKHLHPLGPARFTNHSCSPNCKMISSVQSSLEGDYVVGEIAMEALEDIPAGTGLSFDYNTTEWDMAEKFACLCKTPTCIGKVGGFKFLLPEYQADKRRRGVMSSWMQDLWDASVGDAGDQKHAQVKADERVLTCVA